MNKLKSFLVLIVAILALGGVLWWQNSGKKAASQKQEKSLIEQQKVPSDGSIESSPKIARNIQSSSEEEAQSLKASSDQLFQEEQEALSIANTIQDTTKYGQVAGKVVGPEGEPVKDCEAIFLRQGLVNSAIQDFAGRGRYRETEPYGVTDASGEFLAENIPVGTYIIAWRAPGYIYRAHDDPVTVRAGETTKGIFQELEKAGVIFGQVVENLTGKPIENAKVSAQIISSNKHEGDLLTVHKKLSTFSGKNGDFRLDCLLSSEQYDLTAEHSRYADGKVEAAAVDSGVSVRLFMSPGGSIEGRVIMATDRSPVEGARVFAEFEGKTIRQVKSATDGIFLIEGLGPNSYTLLATQGRFRSEPMEGVQVRLSSELKKIELVLHPGPLITGTVRDKQTGQPIAKAEVVADEPTDIPFSGAFILGDKAKFRTETDSNGVYELVGMPSKKIMIIVTAEGYMRTEKTLTPANNEDTLCDFDLEPGGDVNVLVVDKEEKPIEGAMVIAMQGMKPTGNLENLTDADGKVKIEGVSLQSPPMIMAMKQGYTMGMPVTAKFPEGEKVTEVRIVLASSGPGGVFAGKVENSIGAPIQGAQVIWFAPMNQEQKNTTTDENGKYRLEVQGTGMMAQLQASADGYAPASKTGVSPGTPEEPKEVNFVLESGHWLDLVVVDPEDQPIDNVLIMVFNAGFPPSPLPSHLGPHMTDEEGRCHLENLPGPKISLMVNRKGYASLQFKTVDVDQESRLVLAPLGVIQGRVQDQLTQEPVKDFSVTASAAGGDIFSMLTPAKKETFSSSDGRFALSDLDQGKEYRVTIEAENYAPTVKNGIKPQPEEAENEPIYYLVRDGQLLGIAYDAMTRQALPNIPVVYGEYDSNTIFDWSNLTENNFALSQVQSTVTDLGGTFSFSENEKEGTLFIKAKGYENLMLKPEDRIYSESGILEIYLKSGASLSGQYHDQGLPLSDETLLLAYLPKGFEGALNDRTMTDPEGIESMGIVQTDAEGLYEYDDLKAGTYQISNQRMIGFGGLLALGRRFDLQSGEQKTVNLGDHLGPYELYGRILDPAGNPIPNDAILTLQPKFSWEYSDFGTNSGADGQYRIGGLREGSYKVTIYKIVLDNGSLLSQMSTEVYIQGNTQKDFIFAVGNKVTGRLVFPEDMGDATREKYIAASLEAVDMNSSRPEGISTLGFCFIQEETLNFTGQFQGEYRIKLTGIGGANPIQIPTSIHLDNLEADQDIGEVMVP